MNFKEVYLEMTKEEKQALTKFRNSVYFDYIKRFDVTNLTQKVQVLDLNRLLNDASIEKRRSKKNSPLTRALNKLQDNHVPLTISESTLSRLKTDRKPTKNAMELEKINFRSNLSKYCNAQRLFYSEVEIVLVPCRPFSGDLLASVVLDYLNTSNNDLVLAHQNLNTAVAFYLKDRESAHLFKEILMDDAEIQLAT